MTPPTWSLQRRRASHTPRRRSSIRIWQDKEFNMLAMIARCVASAPFGRPVVPDVYMMVASSSGPRSTSGRPICASPAQLLVGPTTLSIVVTRGSVSFSPPRAMMMDFSSGKFGKLSRIRSIICGSITATRRTAASGSGGSSPSARRGAGSCPRAIRHDAFALVRQGRFRCTGGCLPSSLPQIRKGQSSSPPGLLLRIIMPLDFDSLVHTCARKIT